MKAYQLKLVIKNTKPPVWKRCFIPAGITFAQLSIILEDIMEISDTDRYEFEFYQKKIHVREWCDGTMALTTYNYDYMCASDTYINDLLEEKDWFTFRIEDGEQYRVTIEKCLEDSEILFPVIIKQKGVQDIRLWSDIEEKNSELEQYLFVKYGEEEDYRTHEAVQKELESGQKGLRGSIAAVSRQDRSKKSAMTVLRDFVDQVLRPYMDDVMEEKQLKEPDYSLILGEKKKKMSRWGNLKTYFLSYSKDELREIAEELHLLRYKNLNKSELADKIKNELLRPSVMRSRLLLFNDEEIGAFEEAIEMGGCYFPKEDVQDILESFYRLHYVIIYEDDCVEVPAEVAKVYSQINTPEYQDKRRKASWMYECLEMTDMIYGVAPAKIVHRMYRKQYKIGYKEFLDIFGQIPEEDRSCVICENKIISKAFYDNGEYIGIERGAEGIQYYIPEKSEIRDYVKNGYPSEEACYKKLRVFMIKDLQLEEWYVEALLADIWGYINMGYGLSTIMDVIEDEEIIFPSQSVSIRFSSIISEIQSRSRRLVLRGNRQEEVLRGNYRVNEKTHLESPTCEITALNAESDKPSTKIYPNDPCPCGSGKKYKKCCGRRK